MAEATVRVQSATVQYADNAIKRQPTNVIQNWYPGAMIGLDGSGNAIKCDDTVAGIKFDGINALTDTLMILTTTSAEQQDAAKQLMVQRPFRFVMAIAAATEGDEGRALYAVDDQTVGYTSTNLNLVGYVDKVITATSVLVRPEYCSGIGRVIPQEKFPLIPLSVNGAIPPHTAANYVITKAGVLADTLAAPTATTDDGIQIVVTSNTANAHTITATGLLQTGTASVNVATFAAQAGASLTLMAYQGKWNVLSSNGITFS